MKKMRLLAWLLVIALLSMTCAALGEAPELELSDDAAAASGELEMELGEDGPGLVPDGIDLELPDLDLSEGLSVNLSTDLDAGAEANGGDAVKLSGTCRPEGSWDNDALFAGYVDMLFGRQDALGLQPNGYVGDRLTGVAAKLYDYLVKQIKKVAAGTLSDTRFYVPKSVVPYSKIGEAFEETGSIYSALLLDCPYHLFWHDKEQGIYYGYNDDEGTFIFFAVEEEYANDTYETNAKRIKTANAAATKARSVVKKYAGKSDYEKLCGYRDFICKSVDYNDDAASDPNWPYGNPWQLIWVFDGDPSTDVVCEGFAKAFQYLCDLSTFTGGVQSHIVNGYAYDRSGSGPHMWNIVTMEDDKSYHVDVTFIDAGMKAAFLCGAGETEYENTYLVRNEVYYQVDDVCVAAYPAKLLKLSTSDYKPGSAVAPKSVKLKKGNTTLKKGQKLNLARGKSLTLKAVVSPGNASTTLTWKSSYKYVTVKNGKVTVNKKAKAGTKAKITVTTANKKSTYIYIVVK